MVLGLLEIDVLLPINAPIIEAISDNPQPPQTRPHHKVVVQKLGSTKAAIIPSKLLIRGTYHTLFGFSFTIKKQQTVTNKPDIIYADSSPESPPMPSAIPNNNISDPKKANNAKTAPGSPAKSDFLLFVFILWIV